MTTPSLYWLRQDLRLADNAALTAAAAQGLGLALVPRLLVGPELARGELVVACDQVLPGDRAYYLVQPERGEERPALGWFKAWLLQAARTEAGAAPDNAAAQSSVPR